MNESAVASGYPMLTEVSEYKRNANAEDFARFIKLGKAKPGSGHDNSLKGVIVQADIQAPEFWWLQWGRYHFQDIVSSTSKMHRLNRINIKENCTKYVLPGTIETIEQLQKQYNDNPTYENFRILLDNTPDALMLTARITTNYLQLKTMYYQRHTHKVEEWNTEFVEWLKELPLFMEICG